MDAGRRVPRTPQGEVNTFWSKFSRRRPSKVTSIFPRLLYASLLPIHPDPRGASSARNAAESYDIAARECRDKVRRIKEECERTNEKFTDPDFDIESDFVAQKYNCLYGIRLPPVPIEGRGRGRGSPSPSPSPGPASRRAFSAAGTEAPGPGLPGSVHRLDWIFRNPQFTVNGYSHTDVQQGVGGDCWWLAAIATIAHRKDLMDKICVARDEECGVYGFVFQRDGEWISTIVDDNLYLRSKDFRERAPDFFDPDGSESAKFRDIQQKGSEALFFSRCSEQNETWLPLMEKAYAKAHGDYEAIDGGYVGDGVEDMTGGVTTTIAANKVLRKDRLWKELSGSDGQFVFGLSANRVGGVEADSGVTLGHAYTILQAVEAETEDGRGLVRLVKIRNPWGKRDPRGRMGEWNGRWSDGAEEWTPYWMEKLDHRFRNDGIFWMEYGDMLQTFGYIYRTRLFDERWTVIQQWASSSVSWVTGYLRTKFIIDVKKAGMFVLVMAQLDTRYFRGLEGQYRFSLHFVLRKQGSQFGDYICAARPTRGKTDRSVSSEIHLEAGQYEVVPQITAERLKKEPVEYLVPEYADFDPQKLRQVGLQYDLAHAKGGIPDEDMNIELEKSKSKSKPKPHKSHHSHIRGKGVQFNLDVMSPKEPAPSEGDGSISEDAAELDEFQDAAEGPDTNGDGARKPGAMPTETLPAVTNHTEVEDGESPPGKELHQSERAGQDLPLRAKRSEGEVETEHRRHLQIDVHAEPPLDEPSDSDDSEDDYDQWNAVCVACLRVYSRDPDLTITLVEGSQGASNLIRGQEPAGATM